MSTSLGENTVTPWLIGLKVTTWAQQTDWSTTGLRRLASRTSSAEMMESLVGVISRISPLDAELMLIVSLSAEERSSSSEL